MANSNGWGDGAANNSIGWGQGANNAIAWGDSHAKSWAGATDIVGITTDPAASAYFASTGITGATQQTAIDNLVKGLKQDGLWSKMKAVYPFVTDNRNLLGYTEDFSNAAWSKSFATITSNTTTAPDGTLTADTLTQSSNDGRVFQTINNSNQTFTVSVYVKGNSSSIGKAAGIIFWRDSTAEISSTQLILTSEWQRIQLTKTFSSVPTTVTFRIDPIDGGGLIGDSAFIWGAQLELGSTATTYQPIATTQQAYISNQFKYNLVNPVDSDAAFRLVFNGGWTHSANGATPNGTNGYADTKLIPNTNLTLNSVSFSVYSRNNVTPGANNQSFGVSSVGSFTPLIGTTMLTTKGVNSYVYNYLAPDLLVSAVNQNLAAMFITTRTAANNAKSFRNTTQLAAVTTQGQTTQPTTSFTFGAFRNSTSIQDYATFEHAFAHIGDGLTDTEAANLYTRVQAFQTALSRQV